MALKTIDQILTYQWKNMYAHPQAGQRKSGQWAVNNQLIDAQGRAEEIDFLNKVVVAKDGHNENMNYTRRQKVEAMVQNGILAKNNNKYYITDYGKTWFDGFHKDKESFFTKTFTPSVAPVTGMGQN